MANDTGFDAFVRDVEPRLHRALVARHGYELGREATVDALVYAWRHWKRVRSMDNPVGYLYRVGVTSPSRRARPPLQVHVADDREPWIEPGLESALDRLSEPQRVCVVLRHSFEWTYDEIAQVLDVSVSTVRNHLARGLDKLRAELEVSIHD